VSYLGPIIKELTMSSAFKDVSALKPSQLFWGDQALGEIAE